PRQRGQLSFCLHLFSDQREHIAVICSRGTARISQRFRCFPATAMTENRGFLRRWPNPLAVLWLHLTARSANGVQNCTFGVRRVCRTAPMTKILVVRHGQVEGISP